MNRTVFGLLLTALFFHSTVHWTLADEHLRLRDICRLKGQEKNTLQGLGLVVGLKGTGDSKLNPTSRALARMMQVMGSNIAADSQGFPDISELEGTGNVALVMVSADIPPAGAQQGDALTCSVSAINAKSLEGGTLMVTHMLGPRVDQPTIYALSQGQISIPNLAVPTSGMIYQGCKMERTVANSFTWEDKLTLIIDQDLASFSTAVDIEDQIKQLMQSSSGDSRGEGVVHALDQLSVEVTIPQHYREAHNEVQFVAILLDMPLNNIKKKKSVVINEVEGVIVLGEDVLINPVVINHKNLAIQANAGPGGFVGVDTSSPAPLKPKLKNLVDALNALNVSTEDKIAIIRTLKRNGDIYGEVLFE
ncbi:MAG: flagellar basal body P-ring protein FlgI [Planctomycetales bacterium]|nr:flagellar basal body P-ring protein FlgI [Planctomycetales bacterium]